MFILDGCGDLPNGLILLISWCFKIIKIGVPIALVIWGMLDFAKATFASKEDEMEKAKKNFIMRIIAGAAVFLVLAITQWIMNIVSVNDADSMASCVAGLMNGTISSTLNEDNDTTTTTKSRKTTTKPRKTTTTMNATMEKEGSELFLWYEVDCGQKYSKSSYESCVDLGGTNCKYVSVTGDNDPKRSEKLACIKSFTNNGTSLDAYDSVCENIIDCMNNAN